MSRDSQSPIASSLIVPQLSLRRGWKPSKRLVQEVPPQALLQDDNPAKRDAVVLIRPVPSSSSDPQEVTCSVCQRHCSRYKCPQCHVPYCSVECYRNHSTTTNGNTTTPTKSACTEVFYKNRVSSMLELEAKEQKDDTQRMLNQYYQTSQQTENILDDDDNNTISDQLYEFLQFLESHGDTNLTDQELLAMMPLELRSEFLQDLQDGKLQQTIVKPWHPWWRRKLGPMEEDDSSTTTRKRTKTLDERLLSVPSFSTLCKKQQSPQLLLYNLIDIVYSFCWTLRLYHGLDNIMATSTHAQHETSDAVLVVEAGLSLFQNSTVLRDDARHASLEQVLSCCTSSSTKVFPDGCNTSWSILVEDCAHILASHRLVGRVLLEACDLWKVAIQHLKQETSLDDSHQQQVVARLRQVRKKVEFFLSWSQDVKDAFGESIKNDMMEWIQQWTSNEFQREGYDGPTTELQLPEDQTNLQQPPKQKSTKPLIVEVATKYNK